MLQSKYLHDSPFQITNYGDLALTHFLEFFVCCPGWSIKFFCNCHNFIFTKAEWFLFSERYPALTFSAKIFLVTAIILNNNTFSDKFSKLVLRIPKHGINQKTANAGVFTVFPVRYLQIFPALPVTKKNHIVQRSITRPNSDLRSWKYPQKAKLGRH